MKRFGILAISLALAAACPAVAQTFNAALNYANPDDVTTNSYRQKGPCNDPWVSIALERVYGRADASYCSVSLYNGGQWRDFNELVHAVAATRNSLTANGLTLKGGYFGSPSVPAIGIFQRGSLVGAGAGNLVGAGAGNIVGAGAGNLVGAGAGNLVGAGAGNAKWDPPGTRRLNAKGSVSLPVGALSW